MRLGLRSAGLAWMVLGDSIGRWENDVLVVETVHSTELKVIERLRRVGDTLEYQAVAHDPAVLVEPWVTRSRTLWLADQELEEPARCEDREMDLITDGSHHDNPR